MTAQDVAWILIPALSAMAGLGLSVFFTFREHERRADRLEDRIDRLCRFIDDLLWRVKMLELESEGVKEEKK